MLLITITDTLPRTTRHVGAWIEQEFGVKPLWVGCAASSFGDGAPQTASGVTKARRDQTEGVH